MVDSLMKEPDSSFCWLLLVDRFLMSFCWCYSTVLEH